MIPPFRADHIGSLLRPKKLRDAFRNLSGAQLRAVQDECIREVVKLQKDCGLEVVTDGEFRRISYWEKFVRLTAGLEVRDAVFTFHDAAGPRVEVHRALCERQGVARREPITLDEFRFQQSKDHHAGALDDALLPLHRLGQRLPRRRTNSSRELGKVYQQEIADLAKSGCRYVQLDEVAVAILCDPAAREKVKAGGEDPDRLVDLYIDAINQAVKNRPAGMTVGVHVCRGNYKGMYLSEGGYDSVAEKFFSRTDVDHFLLEFDTPRAGGFAPLRFVPKGKGVVLGLVSSKTPQLESMDVLQAPDR